MAVFNEIDYGLGFIYGSSVLVEESNTGGEEVDADKTEGEDAGDGEEAAVETKGKEAEDILTETDLKWLFFSLVDTLLENYSQTILIGIDFFFFLKIYQFC